MRRSATAVASLIAILALLGVPVGDTCPMSGEQPHGCCAAHAPEPVRAAGGCCGAEPAATHDSPTLSGSRDTDCQCVHAPAAPAAIAVGTPTPSLDGVAAEPPHSAIALISQSGSSLLLRTEHVPRAGPAPLFMLDCAFLI